MAEELQKTQKQSETQFADPVKKCFPLGTKEHVLASLKYIGLEKNRKNYDPETLKDIELKINVAAGDFGVDTSTRKSVSFNFLTNLTKTYEEDGKHYVEGVASGTSRDSDDEVMAKSAIQAMQKSIEDGIVAEDGSLIKIPLYDTHKVDGVLAELGELVSASISEEDNDLYVKALLYDDNPAAMSLVKQVAVRKKKFGFSVSGVINKIQKTWDNELGRHIKMFTDVSLEHVAVTTRPSYAPSLGTVIAKSVKEFISSNELETSEEENPQIMEKENLQETPQAEVTPETKPLVEETSTETANAEVENVEKAKKNPATRAHYEVLRKQATHIHDHLAGLVRGEAEPSEEISHLVDHAKKFTKNLGDLAKGDTSGLDESLPSGSDLPMPFYLSQTETMDQDKIKKSEVEEVAAVETKVEETKVEVEKATQPDLAELIKNAVEAATKPLMEKVESLGKELEVVKNAPVGDPKGLVTKSTTVETSVDTSRVIEKSKESLEVRIQKAIKENPTESPTKVAMRIVHGLDAFGNQVQE